jgi:predicted DNA-binding transcriptional regulator YafY
MRGRRQPVTAARLAEVLEVSERTIYRDVADLMAQGAWRPLPRRQDRRQGGLRKQKSEIISLLEKIVIVITRLSNVHSLVIHARKR